MAASVQPLRPNLIKTGLQIEKRIELRVLANPLPGYMWWARLEAIASLGGTTITNIFGNGYEDSPGDVMFVRTASTSDCFRGLVSVLAADDAEGGIPAEVIDDVDVLGLEGWQADFAKFCWVRDESTSAILGRDFIDFDDWHLERIYGQAGALSDLYRKRERAANPVFYDSFWRLCGDRHAVGALTDRKFPDIVRQLNLIGRPYFWDALLSKVHDLAVKAKFEAEVQAKKRALELAPIRAYAQRAIYQKIGGSLAGIGNALRFNGIVDYVESYLKRTDKYPVGRHTVLYSSTIRNNRVQAPRSTLEVQFPDE
jgi:hypothetical protein